MMITKLRHSKEDVKASNLELNSSQHWPSSIDPLQARTALDGQAKRVDKTPVNGSHIFVESYTGSQSSDTLKSIAINNPLSSEALQDLLRSLQRMDTSQIPLASTSQSEASQIQDALLPIILKNAQRRADFDGVLKPKLEEKIRELLTDEYCQSFSEKLKTIHQEVRKPHGSKESVQATPIPLSSTNPSVISSNFTSGTIPSISVPASQRQPPTAPRALRINPQAANFGPIASPTSSLASVGSRDAVRNGRRASGWSNEHSLPDSAVTTRGNVERESRWDRPQSRPETRTNPVSTTPGSPRTSNFPMKRESPSPSRLHLRRSRSRGGFPLTSPQDRRPSAASRTRRSRSPITHRNVSPQPSHQRSPFRKASPSPVHRKASFTHRKDSFRYRSPSPPPLRRTPVHMRGIDRTRHSPSESQESKRPSLPINRFSRSPRPISVNNKQPRRLSTPMAMDSSGPATSVAGQYINRPLSPPRTGSPSLDSNPLHQRLSREPNESKSAPLMGQLSARHPDSPDKGVATTPALNYEQTQPSTPAYIPFIKREPDAEEFVANLRTGSTVLPTSPTSAVLRSPSPKPPHMEISPAPESPAPTDELPREPSHTSPSPSPTNSPLLSLSIHSIGFPITAASPSPSPTVEPDPEAPIALDEQTLAETALPAAVVSPPIQPALLPDASAQFPRPQTPPQSVVATTENATTSCLLLSSVVRPDIETSPNLAQPAPTLNEPALSPSQHTVDASPIDSRYSVPGIWFIMPGRDQADIIDCEFEVGQDIIQQLRPTAYPSERVSLRLVCLPRDALQELSKDDPTHNLKTEWPERGTLLVQMNPAKPHKRSWFPEHLHPLSPYLEIAGSVREGRNVLRLIQLEDMSSNVFMLHAMRVSPPAVPSSPGYWDVGGLHLADNLASWNLSPATVEVI
ncbi:hypothetical protein H0H93_000188 [Arthromyces matolae]|nr:hypothetical protein H0H93_000188 [Arthromyces matolae]